MTPATKQLAAAGVEYTAMEYDHDPQAASYGMEAAELLGLDPATVFKTLVARLTSNELVVAIVPVDQMLDLKALARAAGEKRADMAATADAERSSGYVAGGISPFGQRKPLRTFVDETIVVCETMYVSGGRRGFDIGVAPDDLVRILDAVIAPIAA